MSQGLERMFLLCSRIKLRNCSRSVTAPLAYSYVQYSFMLVHAMEKNDDTENIRTT